jgi:hypothetical protein
VATRSNHSDSSASAATHSDPSLAP